MEWAGRCMMLVLGIMASISGVLNEKARIKVFFLALMLLEKGFREGVRGSRGVNRYFEGRHLQMEAARLKLPSNFNFVRNKTFHCID